MSQPENPALDQANKFLKPGFGPGVWPLKERLILASAVCDPNNQQVNWGTVNRRVLRFTPSNNDREPSWSSSKTCAKQYTAILDAAEVAKRYSFKGSLQNETGGGNSLANLATAEYLVKKLTIERVDELQFEIINRRSNYDFIKHLRDKVANHELSDEQVESLLATLNKEAPKKEAVFEEYHDFVKPNLCSTDISYLAEQVNRFHLVDPFPQNTWQAAPNKLVPALPTGQVPCMRYSLGHSGSGSKLNALINAASARRLPSSLSTSSPQPCTYRGRGRGRGRRGRPPSARGRGMSRPLPTPDMSMKLDVSCPDESANGKEKSSSSSICESDTSTSVDGAGSGDSEQESSSAGNASDSTVAMDNQENAKTYQMPTEEKVPKRSLQLKLTSMLKASESGSSVAEQNTPSTQENDPAIDTAGEAMDSGSSTPYQISPTKWCDGARAIIDQARQIAKNSETGTSLTRQLTKLQSQLSENKVSNNIDFAHRFMALMASARMKQGSVVTEIYNAVESKLVNMLPESLRSPSKREAFLADHQCDQESGSERKVPKLKLFLSPTGSRCSTPAHESPSDSSFVAEPSPSRSTVRSLRPKAAP